jgi:arginase
MEDLGHSTSTAKVAILGLPADENSSFLKGTSLAPPLIRAALFSEATNLFAENGMDLGSQSLIIDAGDVVPADGRDVYSQIEDSVCALLRRNLRPLILGGDHSITYPVVRAVSQMHPGLTILDFDAHPDLYDVFQGNRTSHACPFARIMEEHLVLRLVQIGIRTMNSHQRQQAERFGVEVIQMQDWQDILPELHAPVYLSFDLDALDPAYAPGVSHREPGGFSVRQALHAIQAVKAEVIGADIVEFNPRMDSNGTTASVCANLLKEIVAKMIETA